MKIRYTVHSVANDSVMVPVQFEDETIQAAVPFVTVELVSEDPAQGNPTIRIRPESEAELAQWAQGAVIIGTFEPQAPDQEQPV